MSESICLSSVIRNNNDCKKINTCSDRLVHYSPNFMLLTALLCVEKLAEAQRRFATLQNELQSSLDAQRESNAPPGLRKRKTVFHLSQEERCKHHNIKDLKLAFSEFYLSLILLQNYQVSDPVTTRLPSLSAAQTPSRFSSCCSSQNLNFTGFRKILKKHDKILDTPRGADWRVAHVEVAPFYTCKKITQLISETEVPARTCTYGTNYTTLALNHRVCVRWGADACHHRAGGRRSSEGHEEVTSSSAGGSSGQYGCL